MHITFGDVGELLLLILISAVSVLAGLLLMFFLLSPLFAKTCESTWEQSGLKGEFGVWTGCLVEIEPGVWISQELVRENDVINRKSPE
jgi:hypothetical protein